jgi:Glycosyl transferase family 2
MSQQHEVHLYALCWNDRRMLPHFFKHYGCLVDRFCIFDNGSTDGSLEMLAGDERVQVAQFETEFDSFVDTELRLSEEVWKASRGVAQWVIVIDIDEHLYHEDLRAYLRYCRTRDVTAIQAVGYEMVSETFPGTGSRLCDVVTTGVRMPQWHDKLCIFDPSAIARTNYEHGRHSASPEGCVRWPAERDVLLLHYKRLGLDYEISRSAELRRGLRSRDIESGWGTKYLLPPEKIAERSRELAVLAKPVPRIARDVGKDELDPLN